MVEWLIRRRIQWEILFHIWYLVRCCQKMVALNIILKIRIIYFFIIFFFYSFPCDWFWNEKHIYCRREFDFISSDFRLYVNRKVSKSMDKVTMSTFIHSFFDNSFYWIKSEMENFLKETWKPSEFVIFLAGYTKPLFFFSRRLYLLSSACKMYQKYLR